MVDNARNFCPQVRNQYFDTVINPQDGDRTHVSCLIFRAWKNGGDSFRGTNKKREMTYADR